MINPAQPPEGILDPQQPWWPADKVGQQTWLRLKGKLTGRPIAEMSGERHTSYVKLGDADADRLIENLKKYGQYPQVNQNDKYGGAYNAEAYQKWLVEEFLEKPFRDQVNDKIDKAVVKRKVKEVLEIDKETEEVAAAVEEPEQLVSVVEDKIDALEAIREEVAPPRSKYQPPPDPWGDPTVPPKVKATAKKTKKKASKRKKRKEAPEASKSEEKKQTFATKMGGSVGKTGKGGVFNSVLSFMEKGSSSEGEGPSVLQIGAAFGRKVQKAFDDAQEQKARAIEAEANGAELPPEVKEKGYFLKKALGYQFGGQVYDQTLGAFLENMPSKQSKKKAGFGAQFDYGDSDPSKKKKEDSIKDLATGFRRVSADLRKVNSSLNENLSVQTSLLSEQTRIADTLEQIQNAIAGLVGIEIESGSDAADAAAAGGDINIGDINLGKKKGFDLFGAIFDIIDGVDDVFDIMRHLRGGKKGLGRQNKLYRNARKKGLPNFKKPRVPKGPPKGKFGMLRTVLGGGLQMLSEGGTVKMAAGGVPAMVGEAGPEMIVPPGAALPSFSGNKNFVKLAQPFANVMQVGMQAQGAQMMGAITSVVSAAGPFSGLIAKMFLPMIGGFTSIFGIKSSTLQAQLKSASMTTEQGAKELLKFFRPIMGLFGGNDKENKRRERDPNIQPPAMLTGTIAQKAKQFAEYLMSKHGMTDFQAAGVVGVMMREGFGGGHPDVREGGQRGAPTYDGSSTEGYGWVQWTNTGGGGPHDRLNRALIHLGMGPPPKETRPWTDADNIKVMEYEWANHYKNTIPSVKKASTLEEAVYEFTGNYTAGSHANIQTYETNEGGGFLERRRQSARSVLASLQASRGVSAGVEFLNNTEGIYKMTGPETGYSVPMNLTGGTPVTGHGVEMLVKTRSKFMILPVVNRDYDAYSDPNKAFDRYAEIGKQGGVNVAGLVDVMDRLLFGKPKTGKTPVYGEGFKPRRTYSAADESGAEILRTLGGVQVKGASLPSSMPMGTVTPVAVPRDTVTGTTGQAVAVVQPMIQYVPVPGPERVVVEEVATNPFVAARKSSEMLYLQGLS